MSPKKKPSAPIYNRVRVLRAERDMSRAQLAEAIDVNPQTVGALERGDHSPSPVSYTHLTLPTICSV